MGEKGWDVDPPGVKGVLKRTEAAAKPLETHAKSLGNGLEAASKGIGFDKSTPELAVVVAALNDFSERANSALSQLGYELTGLINGAVEATLAIVHGDEEMARHATHAAARATTAEQVRHSPRADGL